MNNISIKNIIVIPKRKSYCHYYINENLRDSHTMKYEKIYLFICQFISALNTIKIQEFLSKKISFIVDVENNIVARLIYDNKNELKKMKKDFIHESITGTLKKFNLNQENNKSLLENNLPLISIQDKNLANKVNHLQTTILNNFNK
jgi:hypothetical protein